MTCTLVLDTHGRSGTGRSWLDALAAGPLASTSAGAAISSHNIAPGYLTFDNIIDHRSSTFQPSRNLLKRGSKRHTLTTEPITLTFRIAERRLKHTNTPVARERPPEMSNHGHLKPLPDRQPLALRIATKAAFLASRTAKDAVISTLARQSAEHTHLQELHRGLVAQLEQ